MNNYKVYKYTFPDGMIYIGVTSKSIQYRRDCGYQHNPGLKSAYQKCGWGAVSVEILEDGLEPDEAYRMEEIYIDKFNATDPSVGYNKSCGGKSTFSGLRHTEEYKRRMSERYKGRVFSSETLAKLNESHAKERKPVVAVMPDGTEKEFLSLGEAAASVDGYKANISRACNENKGYKGILWRWKGGDNGEAFG